jgi:hypothetical protein
MRWAGNVARVVEMRNDYNILVGKRGGGGGHVEDLDIQGKLILEWVLG